MSIFEKEASVVMRLITDKAGMKSEFTRRCIGEAVIKLLAHNDIEHLKISEIAHVAGVSRTTFYQYYTTPYSVLVDYLNIIVSGYLIENEKKGLDGTYFNREHIIFSFRYFDQYSAFFHTLVDNKLHSIAFSAINDFMTTHIRTEQPLSVYRLYAYAGALLNSFLQWVEDGRKERVEDIAEALQVFVL